MDLPLDTDWAYTLQVRNPSKVVDPTKREIGRLKDHRDWMGSDKMWVRGRQEEISTKNKGPTRIVRQHGPTTTAIAEKLTDAVSEWATET